jgi:hypothetical protein
MHTISMAIKILYSNFALKGLNFFDDGGGGFFLRGLGGRFKLCGSLLFRCLFLGSLLQIRAAQLVLADDFVKKRTNVVSGI